METEASIREVYEKIHDDFIKCLTRENITDDEKEAILKTQMNLNAVEVIGIGLIWNLGIRSEKQLVKIKG